MTRSRRWTPTRYKIAGASMGDLFATYTGGQAATPSALTLKRTGAKSLSAARQAELRKQGKVKITGTLSPSEGGEAIVVAIRSPKGGWTHRFATAASNGEFTVTVKPKGKTVVVAQWVGDETHAGAGSTAITVKRPKKGDEPVTEDGAQMAGHPQRRGCPAVLRCVYEGRTPAGGDGGPGGRKLSCLGSPYGALVRLSPLLTGFEERVGREWAGGERGSVGASRGPRREVEPQVRDRAIRVSPSARSSTTARLRAASALTRTDSTAARIHRAFFLSLRSSRAPYSSTAMGLSSGPRARRQRVDGVQAGVEALPVVSGLLRPVVGEADPVDVVVARVVVAKSRSIRRREPADVGVEEPGDVVARPPRGRCRRLRCMPSRKLSGPSAWAGLPPLGSPPPFQRPFQGNQKPFTSVPNSASSGDPRVAGHRHTSPPGRRPSRRRRSTSWRSSDRPPSPNPDRAIRRMNGTRPLGGRSLDVLGAGKLILPSNQLLEK